jgi:hypothetical protein
MCRSYSLTALPSLGNLLYDARSRNNLFYERHCVILRYAYHQQIQLAVKTKVDSGICHRYTTTCIIIGKIQQVVTGKIQLTVIMSLYGNFLALQVSHCSSCSLHWEAAGIQNIIQMHCKYVTKFSFSFYEYSAKNPSQRATLLKMYRTLSIDNSYFPFYIYVPWFEGMLALTCWSICL